MIGTPAAARAWTESARCRQRRQWSRRRSRGREGVAHGFAFGMTGWRGRTEPAPHVPALGVAQIVSWGTLFYTIARARRGDARRRSASSDVMLFGSFTAGLFVSGLASPFVGRQIDAARRPRRARRRVAAGRARCAALATRARTAVDARWLAPAGVAMAACLYDPAFATLHQIAGASYRRAVTALTLFGGFASTVFWPLSQYLLDTVGWRAAFAVYAGLHCVLCLPLHWRACRRRRRARRDRRGRRARKRHRRAASSTRARAAPCSRGSPTALALAAFISSAIAAHLIGLLTRPGLSARDAVLIGSLIGPMQVAGRIMEFAFNRHMRALAVGTLAFALMARVARGLHAGARRVDRRARVRDSLRLEQRRDDDRARHRARGAVRHIAATARCSAASRCRSSS